VNYRRPCARVRWRSGAFAGDVWWRQLSSFQADCIRPDRKRPRSRRRVDHAVGPPSTTGPDGEPGADVTSQSSCAPVRTSPSQDSRCGPYQMGNGPGPHGLWSRRDRATKAAVPSIQPCQPRRRRGMHCFGQVVTPAFTSEVPTPGRWIRSGRKLGRGSRPRAPRLVARAANPGQKHDPGRNESAQPQEQYTRDLACTASMGGLADRPAISWTSLMRVASLNCSRSLIAMTKDPGPPITQSS
jgi:hypothetical protein